MSTSTTARRRAMCAALALSYLAFFGALAALMSPRLHSHCEAGACVVHAH